MFTSRSQGALHCFDVLGVLTNVQRAQQVAKLARVSASETAAA
jgi:hypothetical protein